MARVLSVMDARVIISRPCLAPRNPSCFTSDVTEYRRVQDGLLTSGSTANNHNHLGLICTPE
ncbi:hypothetical protein J6590_101677 [Homalodisca vitripennis]|nr:hypothetical protein J6590_101677 [Homalodisca vitripennis]